jgi:hypothetical protein
MWRNQHSIDYRTHSSQHLWCSAQTKTYNRFQHTLNTEHSSTCSFQFACSTTETVALALLRVCAERLCTVCKRVPVPPRLLLCVGASSCPASCQISTYSFLTVYLPPFPLPRVGDETLQLFRPAVVQSRDTYSSRIVSIRM